MPNHWYGVDLDGTLAEYRGWRGVDHIGAPIQPMVDQIKIWRAMGYEVRIMTARVSDGRPETRAAIEAWCRQHLGEVLPITCCKDFDMIELWDDRARRVEFNTGRPL